MRNAFPGKYINVRSLNSHLLFASGWSYRCGQKEINPVRFKVYL